MKRTRPFHVGPGDLVVHNTDSVYLSCPEAIFSAADAAYIRGERRCPKSGALAPYDKEAYWTEMVKLTMRDLTVVRDKVNAMLRADNGTRFLKMAYEEVLWPFALFGKKKYFGVPYAQRYHQPGDELYNAPIFLDCCALVR